MDTYDTGFKLYIAGDWKEAKPHFERALELIPWDSLSKNLLQIMGETNFIAPEDWAGHRHFSE
jgi:hypothetical protein